MRMRGGRGFGGPPFMRGRGPLLEALRGMGFLGSPWMQMRHMRGRIQRWMFAIPVILFACLCCGPLVLIRLTDINIFQLFLFSLCCIFVVALIVVGGVVFGFMIYENLNPDDEEAEEKLKNTPEDEDIV